jgi:predicted Rossmann-fold nucleotide-binding protein
MTNPYEERVELESLAEVRARLADPAADFRKVAIQGVDLTPVAEALASRDIAGCVFLGCVLPEPLAKLAASHDCLIMPCPRGLIFQPYRGALYTADELYAGFDPEIAEASFEHTLDRLICRTCLDLTTRRLHTGVPIEIELFRRVHDHAITDALTELLVDLRAGGKRAVAIMGGHDMERAVSTEGGAPARYLEVARIARALTNAGFVVVSGGGPGAMEAANLGAYLAPFDEGVLLEAIGILASEPKLHYDRPAAWLSPAMEVRRRHPLDPANIAARTSIGVPTWHYGHEPPNPFATHIAKYFENSIREEGLLAIADGGVIFAPGNAGTVQEIFQDACQNYYQSYGAPAPMILFGSDYWNPKEMTSRPGDRNKKVFPLLQKLAQEKGFEDRLLLTDEVGAVVEFVVRRWA